MAQTQLYLINPRSSLVGQLGERSFGGDHIIIEEELAKNP